MHRRPFLRIHSTRTPPMMMVPASAAISSGVSLAPPCSHSSVSDRFPDTIKWQKYDSRSGSPA